MPTMLTPHFSLEELVATQHRNVDNTPSEKIVAALTDTAQHMEIVRHLLGDLPISVSSGYRSPALNALVGGVVASAHIFGHACDFNCHGFGPPLVICRRLAGVAEFTFDQMIEEGTWVHLAWTVPMRQEILTKNPAGGYYEGLPPT